ncbi:MAG TPA: hypothetical protein VF587_03135, partial [Solirubrobacteraceae bacterium]
ESAIGPGETILSVERGRRWIVRLRGARRRTYRLEASLATLRRPIRRVCAVRGARKWSFSRRSRVLRATFRARRATLVVRGCRARR